MKNVALSILLLLISLKSFSQVAGNPIQFSGYVDAYYSYYTDSVGIGNLQHFAVASPISNKFSLNAAMLTVTYSADHVRSKVGLVYGDIPIGSWATQLNMIVEANAGVSLANHVWMDAGIFRTHLGFESVFPGENTCVSSAWGSYFEPVYQAGAKLSLDPNNKLDLCVHVLNGYNLIEETNSKKSVGVSINYDANDNLSFSYNNLYGDDTPDEDTVSHNRLYNTLYCTYENNKVSVVLGGDYATQQNSDIATATQMATLFNNLLILKYQATDKFNCYAREEFFNDVQGFMSGTFTNADGITEGLKSWGATIGCQYNPTENSYVRIESRRIQTDSKQNIFHYNNQDVNSRMEFHLDFGVIF